MSGGPPSPIPEDLERLRAEIERIDRSLITLIQDRTRLARAAADAKRAAGLPTLDLTQEAVVIRRSGALARDAGLPAEEIRNVFWQLVGLARRAQLEKG